MKKFFIVLSFLSLISCTDLQPRKLTFAQKIEVNRSTRGNIIQTFGKPDDMLILDTVGTEVWKYVLSETTDNGQIQKYELVITIQHTGVVYAYIITPINK